MKAVKGSVLREGGGGVEGRVVEVLKGRVLKAAKGWVVAVLSEGVE